MSETFQIRKASGDLEPFNPDKIKRFLNMIKVPQADQHRVVSNILSDCHSGMSTLDLMHKVAAELKQIENGVVFHARYTLKEAIRNMGPKGHNFERYIGRLFEQRGFKVEVGEIQQGKCVTHEIDVAAKDEQEYHLVECKFHNSEGTRSDVTVAMYSYARFEDVHAASKKDRAEYGWLASNTKLTYQALDFAKCNGLKVLNLYFPKGNAIFDRVLKENLFPITVLEELEERHQHLLQNGFVIIQDLLELTTKEVNDLGIKEDVWQAVAPKVKALTEFND